MALRPTPRTGPRAAARRGTARPPPDSRWDPGSGGLGGRRRRTRRCPATASRRPTAAPRRRADSTGRRTSRRAPGGRHTAPDAGCWWPTPASRSGHSTATSASRCSRCPRASANSLTSVLALRNRQASAATGRSPTVTSNPPRRRIRTPASFATLPPAEDATRTGSRPPSAGTRPAATRRQPR